MGIKKNLQPKSSLVHVLAVAGLCAGVGYWFYGTLFAAEGAPTAASASQALSVKQSVIQLCTSQLESKLDSLAAPLSGIKASAIAEIENQLKDVIKRTGELSSSQRSTIQPFIDDLMTFVKSMESSPNSLSLKSIGDAYGRFKAMNDKLAGFGKKDLMKQSQDVQEALLDLQDVAASKLKDKLHDLAKPLQTPQISGVATAIINQYMPDFRRLQDTITKDLEKEIGQLSQSFLSEIKGFIGAKIAKIPGLSKFLNKIDGYRKQLRELKENALQAPAAQLAAAAPQTMARVASRPNAPLEEKIADLPANVAVAAMLHELSDGSTIAIRSGKSSPGSSRYLCVQDDGSLMPTGKNRSDKNCQLRVKRFGPYIGFEYNGKLLRADAAFGLTFAGDEFYADSAKAQHFTLDGELEKAGLKSRLTGGYLSVRSKGDSWSNGGKAMTRDHTGKPAPKKTYETLTIEIVSRPEDPLAKSSPALDMLQAGTLVAIKSLNKAAPGYVSVAPNGDVRVGSTKEAFYILRQDYWVGFMTDQGLTLGADAESHAVKFGRKSVNFGHPGEHWMFKPVDPNQLTGFIQSRLSTGNLCFPSEAWALGKAWTAFDRDVNPLRKKSIFGDKADMLLPQFIMEPAGDSEASLFAIEIIEKVPADVRPGGSSFSFIPSLGGRNKVFFSENWRCVPGELELVISDIKATEDLFLALSAVAKVTPDTSLRILLGKNDNSLIQILLGEKVLFEAASKAGVLSASSAFWITLKDAVLSLGQGTKIGDQKIGSVQIDPILAQKLEYIAFGGSEVPLKIGSISINKPEGKALAGAFNLPEGFKIESGKLITPAVSGRSSEKLEDMRADMLVGGEVKGRMHAFVLHAGSVFQREHEGWIRIDTDNFGPVEHISMSQDGTLVAVTSNGKIIKYNFPDRVYVKPKVIEKQVIVEKIVEKPVTVVKEVIKEVEKPVAAVVPAAPAPVVAKKPTKSKRVVKPRKKVAKKKSTARGKKTASKKTATKKSAGRSKKTAVKKSVSTKRPAAKSPRRASPAETKSTSSESNA
jgi:hypothetical protein